MKIAAASFISLNSLNILCYNFSQQTLTNSTLSSSPPSPSISLTSIFNLHPKSNPQTLKPQTSPFTHNPQSRHIQLTLTTVRTQGDLTTPCRPRPSQRPRTIYCKSPHAATASALPRPRLSSPGDFRVSSGRDRAPSAATAPHSPAR